MHHPHNPQHAFFAALAAQGRLFDPSSEPLHHAAQHQMGNPLSGLMPPGSSSSAISSFLKPFYNFDMSTPPSSSSSSSSSSSQTTRTNNPENKPNQDLIENRAANNSRSSSANPPSLKRPFESLDNQDPRHGKPAVFGQACEEASREPVAKRLQLECTLASARSRETVYSASLGQSSSGSCGLAQASKMKMRIVCKEASDLASLSEQAITISIELNGLVYKGMLFTSEAPEVTENMTAARSLTPVLN